MKKMNHLDKTYLGFTDHLVGAHQDGLRVLRTSRFDFKIQFVLKLWSRFVWKSESAFWKFFEGVVGEMKSFWAQVRHSDISN